MKLHQATLRDRGYIHQMLMDKEVFRSDEVDCALEMFDQYLEIGPRIEEYIFDCIYDAQQVPLGFVCYGERSLAEGVYDLYWIVVDQRHRSRGLGRRLIAHLGQQLRELHARMILAETSSCDIYASTRAFYEAVGFKKISCMPDLYRDGEDLLIYRKCYQEEMH